MKIEYLPHTADIRMLIEGETLQRLFVAGIKGMGNILKEGICDHTSEFDHKKVIKTISNDNTNLLVDFLSDVLSHCYANKAVYCKLDLLSFKKYEITANVFGVPVNQFDEEIKAVTYHEAQIKKNKNNQWETCIIFDI